ncbi:hypothetical protein P261_00037 [Lachnospiraceae bacterium TWA4]|nr:hypothetical protein P261_00037 [Lachnospiraceae bacterium TWA4]
MDKKQFLRELSDALTGEVPRQVISQNIAYYEEYIESEKALGGQEEVIEQLGPPRLIARSIIDAYEAEYGPYVGESNEYVEPPEESSSFKSSCGIYAVLLIVAAVIILLAVMRFIFSIPGLILLVGFIIYILYFRAGRRN